MPQGLAISSTVNGTDTVISGLEGLASDTTVSRWVVGTNVEYAVHLEHGTSRMPPYPFLRPAIEYVMKNEANGIADGAESIDVLIERLALAIERRAKHYATTGVPPGPDVDTGTLRSSIRAQKVG